MAPLMSFVVALFIALLASVTAQFTNQSAPFTLVVHSENATYNGASLFSCHEGAAIEALCVTAGGTAVQETGAPTGSVYYLNYSTYSGPDLGLLTYNLEVTGESGLMNESEALLINYNIGSNIAVPLFFPGSENAQTVGFTADDKLYIPSYLNDTTVPPTPIDPPANLTRWYVCETNPTGYTYITLSWKLGQGKPENPSCVKVGVKRVWS